MSVKVRIPSKKLRQEFILTCELWGLQKGADLLSKHYGIRRMRVVLDGRRTGNGDLASYHKNKAYFSRKGLNKSNLLHEFYHFLLEKKNIEMPARTEEKEANDYAKGFLKASK
jgi:hypothetical protein